MPHMPGLGEALPHLQETGCIYLDYNATTPIWPEVAQEMLPFLTSFGNPSSAHVYGAPCKAAVELARARVAAQVNAQPREIYFTSCGTESDNWALMGPVLAARQSGAGAAGGSEAAGSANGGREGLLPHVVSSCIEHPAVLECLEAWRRQGLLDYTLVPVDPQGLVSPADVAAAITPATCLASIMHSNNEVGSIQPVAAIARAAHEAAAARGAPRLLVHSDAAQSLGKVDVDVQALGVDLLTIVGHKFGAPKGVAALYIRDGVHIERFLKGGGQESGRRAGTESVLLLAGLGKAAELARQELPRATAHMATMRDRLRGGLLERLPQDVVRINGPADPAQQLPNTLSLSVRGVSASALLAQLSSRLAASAGAACHSHGGPAISGVLAAMKVPEEYAVGTLRLSCGRHTTPQEIDAAVELIARHVREALQRGD